MSNTKNLVLSLIVLFFISISAKGQITIPRPSPEATVIQKVGLAEVTIKYSRPSAKGRKIFGDVVPMGKIWRTGANEPTKISFNDSLTIGGKKIGPGEYALYTIPNVNEWTVIIGKNPSVGAVEHKDEYDVVRFKVKPDSLPTAVETFTIDFANLTNNSADIILSWEKTAVKFRVENEFDSKVMSQIKNRMDDVWFYYQAASYYYDTNRDLEQALQWVNKTAEKQPQFWVLHLKAKIESKLGKCNDAIATAKKSIDKAKEAKNDEYVKFNEKLIAECKKK